jgi:hypothetical protein
MDEQQANRTSNSFDTRVGPLAQIEPDRLYRLADKTRPLEDALDQFAACWDILEDPRSGNAALHDFYELLMIALCTVLCGGQVAADMATFAAFSSGSCARFTHGSIGPR